MASVKCCTLLRGSVESSRSESSSASNNFCSFHTTLQTTLIVCEEYAQYIAGCCTSQWNQTLFFVVMSCGLLVHICLYCVRFNCLVKWRCVIVEASCENLPQRFAFRRHNPVFSNSRDEGRWKTNWAHACVCVTVSNTDVAVRWAKSPHRYWNSRAIWDHTVLPAEVTFQPLPPSQAGTRFK